MFEVELTQAEGEQIRVVVRDKKGAQILAGPCDLVIWAGPRATQDPVRVPPAVQKFREEQILGGREIPVPTYGPGGAAPLSAASARRVLREPY